jgi:hypothetical protein
MRREEPHSRLLPVKNRRGGPISRFFFHFVIFQCFAARKIFALAFVGTGNSRRGPASRRGGEPFAGSETVGFPKP